ncbi:transcription termination/antitermination protein NusG [Adlercreutzia sp. ZJ473]|uniref:transcription termination/antitermination protein NusG n=1 Tax=Adlercreutzia sp. ZJ473 TaxID=2722822 RepID=UPI00155541D4|nr:transcription termination/antitermination NusG family protein [Adlercreutzia sp. ZJ473]
MWFMINVKPGREEEALSLLRGTASADGLEELFVPSAVMRAVCDGEVVEGAEPLIPGVVVAVAPGRREVRAALRHARGVDEVLARGASAVEMNEAEVAFMNALTRPGRRVVGFSEGLVGAGGEVTVTSGPLQGREGLIRCVSRHNKRAYVRMSMAGHEVEACMGLRVTRQRDAARAAKAVSQVVVQPRADMRALAGKAG